MPWLAVGPLCDDTREGCPTGVHGLYLAVVLVCVLALVWWLLVFRRR